MYEALRRVLHGREKVVIEMRYGLAGREEMTQREISSLLNISRSYVSRIEKKALSKLCKEMGSYTVLVS
jgi:RNA polymerase sporulation-specific sigma factor